MAIFKIKNPVDWKGINKTILIYRLQIVYVENPNKSTTKLLKLVSEFRKVTNTK